jgi:hypothetical protein
VWRTVLRTASVKSAECRGVQQHSKVAEVKGVVEGSLKEEECRDLIGSS